MNCSISQCYSVFMARVKISEFCGKKILYKDFLQEYNGISIEGGDSPPKLPSGKYVIKVDQAEKQRNKKGLIKLDIEADEAIEVLNYFFKLGYNDCLIEEFLLHDVEHEKYISLELNENEIILRYSSKGGINVENSTESLLTYSINRNKLENPTNLPDYFIFKLLKCFEENQFTFLEINPFILNEDGSIYFLDCAVEVDSSAEFYVKNWDQKDIREPKKIKNLAEQKIEKLASNTPASLVLKVLNPNGSIFLLLSGGGASIVILDEIEAFGHISDVANYGEYSGNPSEEDTYLYTKEILVLMLKSPQRKKVLFIAGATANFTDVSKTFNGIIRALDETKNKIREQNISVVVRRGGPNEKKGLEAISNFLLDNKIYSKVFGSDISLGSAVEEVLEMNK